MDGTSRTLLAVQSPLGATSATGGGGRWWEGGRKGWQSKGERVLVV